MKLKELIEIAKKYGLKVFTYNPGDGMNRIRFGRPEQTDYFSHSGFFTALGKKQATIWLQGFIAGREYEQDIQSRNQAEDPEKTLDNLT